MVSSTLRPHFTPGKDPVPILREAGWAPGAGLDGAENFVPTGIFLNALYWSIKYKNQLDRHKYTEFPATILVERRSAAVLSLGQ